MTATSTAPQPRPGILDIRAYVPGDGPSVTEQRQHKLASNESPLGASPMALEAYRQVGERLARYPDGSAMMLRQAIAGHYDLEPNNIVCGAGSDELLSLLAHAYLGPRDEAIHTQYGFLMYPIATRSQGAVPIVAAEPRYVADVDNILAAVTARTRIVFIANPNNPTGTYLSGDELKRLHSGLPADVLLVLDCAYAEYMQTDDYDPGFALVRANENVVVTRTFSKIYGLAGLRLGWAYCSEDIADVLNRIRGPFNVSSPAIAAGVAALQDTDFTSEVVKHNQYWRDWLYQELGELGLTLVPSWGNFLLVQFPTEAHRTADDANRFLRDKGVFLRAMAAYGLPDCLRLSVGIEEANRLVITLLQEFMAARS